MKPATQKVQQKTHMKGELLAIMYSSVIKRIYKLSKNSQELNQRLQSIGRQIGLRVADEFNDRSASRLNPAENVKQFIKGILKDFWAVSATDRYKIKSFCGFCSSPEKMFDSVEQKGKFNYLAILTGFICGAVQTMNYSAKTIVEKDSLQQTTESIKNIDLSTLFMKNQTVIRVKMEKQIKNQD